MSVAPRVGDETAACLTGSPALPGVASTAAESVDTGRGGDGKSIGVTTITSAVRISARKKRLSIRRKRESYGTGS